MSVLNVRTLAAGLRAAEVASFESPRIDGQSHLRTFSDGFRILRTIARERRPATRACAALGVPRPVARIVNVQVLHAQAEPDHPVLPTDDRSATARGRELMRITTSVVICAYTAKRCDQLIVAVESVQTQHEPVGEIVLVIDHHDELLTLQPPRAADIGAPGAQPVGLQHVRAPVGAARGRWFPGQAGPHAGQAARLRKTELCIRAQFLFPHGRFLLESGAVVHHAGAERSSLPYFRARCRAEGIAKARVARNVGRSAALSAERAYVRRVLPGGVLRNLARGLFGDLAALACAGAIVAGLAFTATGFLKIRWTRPAGPPQEVGSTLRDFRAGTNAQQVLPLGIDVSSPSEVIDARRAGQPPYASALCLLTRNGDPVTKVRLDLPEAVVAGDEVDARLRLVLGAEVRSRPAPPAPACPSMWRLHSRLHAQRQAVG